LTKDIVYGVITLLLVNLQSLLVEQKQPNIENNFFKL